MRQKRKERAEQISARRSDAERESDELLRRERAAENDHAMNEEFLDNESVERNEHEDLERELDRIQGRRGRRRRTGNRR